MNHLICKQYSIPVENIHSAAVFPCTLPNYFKELRHSQRRKDVS